MIVASIGLPASLGKPHMTSRSAEPIKSAAITLWLLLAASAPSVFAQDMKFRDGRFLETVGNVTIQRADEPSSDEAVLNMPFLPGDRVWTDDSGRAEIVFADGEILWIAERSKVDSLGRGGREQDERLGLRVFAGSFGARVRAGGPGFEFRVPGGTVTTAGASAFRVDVRAGETLVSASEGEILVDLAGERMTLRNGERVRYADRAVDGPYRYARGGGDSFDRWCEERFEELSRMARNRDDARLPDELDPYSDELNRNGEWVYDESQGYVYVPRVAYDWAPYTYGRWVFTLYGWTWVADEPWGFVTSHYGRWGYSASIGWHWMPRAGFAGAWVGWSSPVGNWSNTIGWCALGYNDRPVGSFGYGSGGRAVPRGEASSSAARGWTFANRSDLGRAGATRRRIDVPVEEAQRAVVWNPGVTPDREFREVRRGFESRGARGAEAGGAVSRGDGRSSGGEGAGRIYVRPSPGDSLPELRSDPATTIPNPEARRAKTIGQDGFKEEQDRKNQRDESGFYGGVFVSPSAGEPARPRRTNPPNPEPQASPAGGAGGDSGKATTRDPLLSRFFRSITRTDAERDAARTPSPARDPGAARNDDGSARRREAAPRDDSSAREATPREPSRPAEARPPVRTRDSGGDQNRDRSRPPGVERAQPRNPPPPQASPRGGSSDDRGARRKPGPER